MSPDPMEFPRCPLADCALRAATDDEVEVLLDLDRAHMKVEVERLYPGQWDEENARRTIRENLGRARVVEHARCVVAGCYWTDEEPGTAVLLSIQVAKRHRRKGLGAWLLGCFEAEARSRGFPRAGLAVFDGNPARRLYERLGYCEVARDGPHAAQLVKDL